MEYLISIAYPGVLNDPEALRVIIYVFFILLGVLLKSWYDKVNNHIDQHEKEFQSMLKEFALVKEAISTMKDDISDLKKIAEEHFKKDHEDAEDH